MLIRHQLSSGSCRVDRSAGGIAIRFVTTDAEPSHVPHISTLTPATLNCHPRIRAFASSAATSSGGAVLVIESLKFPDPIEVPRPDINTRTNSLVTPSVLYRYQK